MDELICIARTAGGHGKCLNRASVGPYCGTHDPSVSDHACRYCGRTGRRGFVLVAGEWQCAAQTACMNRMTSAHPLRPIG